MCQGWVFLDSAGNGYHPAPLSILTAGPDDFCRGSIHEKADAAVLREALESMRADIQPADLGIPLGGLFGAIEFDGAFAFGRYPSLLAFDHLKQCWLDIGGFLDRNPEALDVSLDESVLENTDSAPLEFLPVSDRRWYESAVHRAQEYIAAGDI